MAKELPAFELQDSVSSGPRDPVARFTSPNPGEFPDKPLYCNAEISPVIAAYAEDLRAVARSLGKVLDIV
jgi:hypothetical protein